MEVKCLGSPKCLGSLDHEIVVFRFTYRFQEIPAEHIPIGGFKSVSFQVLNGSDNDCVPVAPPLICLSFLLDCPFLCLRYLPLCDDSISRSGGA